MAIAAMAEDLVATAAGAREALGQGHNADELPRYELFHAARSICSQKVRAVLAHHHFPYVGRELDLFAGETYLPGYVRLRMLGCAAFGGILASHHDGSTSAEAGGCDGAVIPTLIDWRVGTVIVDSKRICLHLDGQVRDAARLRPDSLKAAIDGDLTVVDNLPNYQMLMTRPVGGSVPSADAAGSFSRRKVAWCDRYLDQCRDEPTLVAAYTAKRAKELSAAEALFSPEAMQVAYDRAEAALLALERKLLQSPTRWLHGDTPTMADLFWGIELLRMEDVGAAHLWQGGRLPHVERFVGMAAALLAIRAAVIEWPGAML